MPLLPLQLVIIFTLLKVFVELLWLMMQNKQ